MTNTAQSKADTNASEIFRLRGPASTPAADEGAACCCWLLENANEAPPAVPGSDDVDWALVTDRAKTTIGAGSDDRRLEDICYSFNAVKKKKKKSFFFSHFLYLLFSPLCFLLRIYVKLKRIIDGRSYLFFAQSGNGSSIADRGAIHVVNYETQQKELSPNFLFISLNAPTTLSPTSFFFEGSTLLRRSTPLSFAATSTPVRYSLHLQLFHTHRQTACRVRLKTSSLARTHLKQELRGRASLRL